jgi:hypothetical protein
MSVGIRVHTTLQQDTCTLHQAALAAVVGRAAPDSGDGKKSLVMLHCVCVKILVLVELGQSGFWGDMTGMVRRGKCWV